MPHIIATAAGFPPHYYSQATISAELQALWSERGVNPERVAALHANAAVEGRHIAVAKEDFEEMRGWERPNAAFAEAALALGQEVLEQLFERAGIGAEDVALLAFASTTGLAVPTIDARLMNRLPFRPDCKRMPFFGLGCVAGAAGTARVADYLRGHPTEAAVLLVEEFCSLTIQKHDTSIANIIACGLFGDAAAALLLVGDEHPLAARAGPEVLATRSVFFPDSEHVMGWTIREAGMQIVLSADVPRLAREPFGREIRAFLDAHGLAVEDVGCWICHPGGPKVIEALEDGLGLGGEALRRSREVLREIGNVSSASVLVILERIQREAPPAPGTLGLMLALGPGFCAELLLLRW